MAPTPSTRLQLYATAFGLEALLPFCVEYHTSSRRPLAQFALPDVLGLHGLVGLPPLAAKHHQMSISLTAVAWPQVSSTKTLLALMLQAANHPY